jgi:hypothetical protein
MCAGDVEARRSQQAPRKQLGAVQKGDRQCGWGITYDLERLAGIFNALNNAREAPSLAAPPPHGSTSGCAVQAARI